MIAVAQRWGRNEHWCESVFTIAEDRHVLRPLDGLSLSEALSGIARVIRV